MHSPKRFSRYANYFNGQNIGPKYRYCMFLKEIKFSYQNKTVLRRALFDSRRFFAHQQAKRPKSHLTAAAKKDNPRLVGQITSHQINDHRQVLLSGGVFRHEDLNFPEIVKIAASMAVLRNL